ncbi:hypothetical protein ACVWWU_001076 [Pantoea sp. PA1]|jgi:hypothetical protein|uniref:Morphogenetic protein n=3 Tax=Pantoea ananas TaxID=553 RepID=D4GH45_PANAM|nr:MULTISPECIES: hypothetical protein [Pantoea]ADD77492.1 Hypothetical Protein PANA_2325 [Pantoea ananatis LMG 20103]AER32236.1 hypothetical protein PAGR_g1717 [Pantoea ananatis PA13]ASN14796.1 hypothetical protein B7764_06200 [Pantoea ananatis]ERM12685.1 hypothetical protein L585_00575 [Pantoea ananatis BRT175]KNA28161.1 hypothetical protein ACO03_04005 [Pantoea ananatis]
MKERPILFSEQRVRALLVGQQTQTRRIMKTQAFGPGQDHHEGVHAFDVQANHLHGDKMMSMNDIRYHCPYGMPGDVLWVRETWRGPIVPQDALADYERDPVPFRTPEFCQYRADSNELGQHTLSGPDDEQFGWQTAIHMPRWASRINLLITDVRVEQIQDISEDDIMAEGVQTDSHFLNNFFTMNVNSEMPKEAYRKAWQKQYGATSWQVNPWVWVIEFERAGRE